MASPQIEDGYLKIANEVMYALIKSRVPGQERQVFDSIMAKTWGFNKKRDPISNSQFCKLTGLHKVAICKAINNLLSKNMITKNGNTPIPTYGIQKDYARWKLLPKKVTLPKMVTSVTKKGKGLLPKMVPTKDISTKDTIKEYSVFFEEFWKRYPKKRNKKQAWKEWQKVKVPDNILDILLKQIDNKGSLRIAGQFTPEFQDPERWIKNERWNDGLEKIEENKPKGIGTCTKCKRENIDLLEHGLCRDCQRY